MCIRDRRRVHGDSFVFTMNALGVVRTRTGGFSKEDLSPGRNSELMTPISHGNDEMVDDELIDGVDETCIRLLRDGERLVSDLATRLKEVVKEEGLVKKSINDMETKYRSSVETLLKDFKAQCDALLRTLGTDVGKLKAEQHALAAELRSVKAEKLVLEDEIIRCEAKIVVLEDTVLMQKIH
eukprot:TRINITY_DN3043_c0_g1_i1.p1 TRINITY_DN3043_c0_g1~~TRINITY_DN3043_c0_g1_i1.p1  ORF type:complete len:182 (-),score=48.63 TRINITY_DN3043_c0_g1_i1:193-738(-)